MRFVDPAELLEPDRAGAGHRAALTFDDGIVSVREHALPILAELGVPAVLYVVSGWVGRHNGWPGQPDDAPRYELLPWEGLRELAGAGFTIGSHTANHVRLEAGAVVDWRAELVDSKQRLEDELGVAVRHFAYPYGALCDEAVERVGAVYATAVTTELAYTDPGRPPHRLPRLDTYYLRDPRRRLPVFGAATRRYLAARAVGRRVRGMLFRS